MPSSLMEWSVSSLLSVLLMTAGVPAMQSAHGQLEARALALRGLSLLHAYQARARAQHRHITIPLTEVKNALKTDGWQFSSNFDDHRRPLVFYAPQGFARAGRVVMEKGDLQLRWIVSALGRVRYCSGGTVDIPGVASCI
ncbi:hypothetical protein DFP83_10549 [Idiomarina fontislapidosi]|uniref:Uncharacterized protein n=1 Tax=Idiomarina fontislapidosi TaxID=263723 RepID=A0A432XYM2_9GAMM|nr:hypothetical protein [Idiomarina fontislapidosi]PYE32742.1 hypothetical protein DFP83_10549 [Idiomarina fontislapidosi]RUO53816.1 hypothetical protein CWE25_07965 [Idiomarina fontislapidosi]